jgi:hypothetical protein
MGLDPDPDRIGPTMRRNPFLDFQVTAEKAGYPALLFVSLLCLTLVVVPVALLALTKAVWVLVLALLSLIGAIAILAAGIGAALADRGEPDLRAPNADAASDEPPQVVPLRRSFGPRGTDTTGRLPSHAIEELVRSVSTGLAPAI